MVAFLKLLQLLTLYKGTIVYQDRPSSLKMRKKGLAKVTIDS